MSYQRTQTAPLTVAASVVLGLVLIAVVGLTGSGTDAVVAMTVFVAVVALLLAAFNRLTVQVVDDEVVLRFRWGWPSKRISLREVHRVDVVRNTWWYGFGVRVTPHGWMYNVWGLDAVQLDLRDGNAFRIGTDDPAGLAAALSSRLGQD